MIYKLSGNQENLRISILANTIERMIGLLRCKFANSSYAGTVSEANKEYRKAIRNYLFIRNCKWKYIKKLSWKNIFMYLLFKINRYPVVAYHVIRKLR